MINNTDNIPSEDSSIIEENHIINEEDNTSTPIIPVTSQLTFSEDQPNEHDWFSSKEYIVFQC